jgi:hypothetical protein
MKKIVLLILLMLNAGVLSAQNSNPGSPEREGFLFGVAAGGGTLLVKDSGNDWLNYGKLSILNLKLGWLVTPQTALCLHIPSGGHSENGETRAFEAVLAAGQHWFSRRVWGLAGAGLAMDMPPFYETENDDPQFYFGTALSAALGYEIIRRKSFVLDVQARCVYGNYEVESVRRQSIAFDILIGFNFY